ncbi:MAG: hypothetical protein ACPIA7_09445 [Akkermansiaceae bacterium]
MKHYHTFFTLLLLCGLSQAQQKDAPKDTSPSIATVSYDVRPGGTVEKPLIPVMRIRKIILPAPTPLKVLFTENL